MSDEGQGFSPDGVGSSGPRGGGGAGGGGRGGGGYGLKLLQAGASRWGTETVGGRFSVWFEIDHAEQLPPSA